MYTTFKTKDIVKYKQIYNDYEVEKVPCNLGGYKYYIKCFECQHKCLKMYINKDKKLVCSSCIGLRKKQLNRTKTSPNYYYNLMIKQCLKVDKHYTSRLFHEYWWLYRFPPKPKKMKYDKYIKALNKWLKYKDLAFNMCYRNR